ncbi:cylJ protein [Lactococcus allomyrinae]|uniref:CylJ protein n=1 Tax=Lactococcus allomyrinae TaxID=2419773 RepID=A0A387BDN9_9LACT|nr:cylJ protein [Lactococcus allomyrinae]AYG02065.1 cylJ protein [Lactococcus allomyrinae]
MKKFLFAPFMMNLGESQRLSQIAQRLQEEGYEIHILGKNFYPFLFENPNYIFHECLADEHIYSEERYKDFFSFDTDFNFLTDEEIKEVCNFERKLLNEYNFSAVFTGYRLSIVVSCKIEKVPLIWIISGAIHIDEIVQNIEGIVPNNMNYRLQSEAVKNTLKRVVLSYSNNVKSWNRYLQSEGTSTLKNSLELFTGDLNLIADYSKFYMFNNQKEYKIVGPILFSAPKKFLNIDNKNKKILLSFGTSFDKEWVQQFIEKLPNEYSYILTTCGEKFHLGEKDIELQKFIDFKNLSDKISFAIIHGGQGTVYAMAEQAIPFIGIPFFNEQLWNIKKFSDFGAAFLMKKEEDIKKIISTFTLTISDYQNEMLEISQGILRESSKSLDNVVKEVVQFIEQ